MKVLVKLFLLDERKTLMKTISFCEFVGLKLAFESIDHQKLKYAVYVVQFGKKDIKYQKKETVFQMKLKFNMGHHMRIFEEYVSKTQVSLYADDTVIAE